MVIIHQRQMAGFKVQDAYFPTADEVWRLAETLPPFTTVRAWQAGELSRPHPRQIKHNATMTFVVDLTRGPDEIFSRMSRSTRQLIYQAMRTSGVRIAMNDVATCSDFRALYNEFVSEKRHTGRLSRATLSAHLRDCDVAVAYLNDDPICGLVVVRDLGVRRAEPVYSASSRLRSEGDYVKRASQLYRYLHWHLIQHYHAAGLEVFDFGGIWTENDSIGQFKRSFGGELLCEHNYAFAGPLVHLALRTHRLPVVQALRTRFA